MGGMGGKTILVALACGRSAIRGSWRQATALALVAGLLGGVALGAVAGARHTATAYVLGAGAAGLGVALLGLLAVLALRSVRPRQGGTGVGSSAAARAAAAAGLPAAAVVGTRNALEPGSGMRAVPVRSALLGSVAAVTAVVTAVVFNASLAGLASHPARYGWNWDMVIQAEAGYGSFTPGMMNRLLKDEPAVASWSEFAFAQLPVDGRIVPALGLRRELGVVQPPTTSGRPVSGPGQIELGTVTLRQLGRAALPAAVAARTRPGAGLRAE